MGITHSMRGPCYDAGSVPTIAHFELRAAGKHPRGFARVVTAHETRTRRMEVFGGWRRVIRLTPPPTPGDLDANARRKSGLRVASRLIECVNNLGVHLLKPAQERDLGTEGQCLWSAIADARQSTRLTVVYEAHGSGGLSYRQSVRLLPMVKLSMCVDLFFSC
jgi:hypothetical protein